MNNLAQHGAQEGDLPLQGGVESALTIFASGDAETRWTQEAAVLEVGKATLLERSLGLHIALFVPLAALSSCPSTSTRRAFRCTRTRRKIAVGTAISAVECTCVRRQRYLWADAVP